MKIKQMHGIRVHNGLVNIKKCNFLRFSGHTKTADSTTSLDNL